MTIKAAAFCSYLISVDRGWRSSDYAAANVVKALKGKALIGHFSDIPVNGTKVRLTEANREQVVGWVGAWALTTLEREQPNGRIALVPIPSSDAVVGFSGAFPSQRMANDLASRSNRVLVADVLRWKRALPPAHQGGVRDPKTLLENMTLVADLPRRAVPVLVDDVLTKGGHLLAAVEKLAGTSIGRPRLALVAGRTVLDPPEDPFEPVIEHLDELETDLPGYRSYLVSTNRAGVSGATHHGFASLWAPHERRGDFTQMINKCRARHGFAGDFAWSDLNSKNADFYLDLVDAFFADNRLMVHMIITSVTGTSDRVGDPHLKRCVEMLHRMKMRFFASGAEPELFNVRLAFPDDWPARASDLKALEAELKGGAARLSVLDRQTSRNPFTQLADLLLAAVLADWERTSLNDGQRAVRSAVINGFGWEKWGDLRGDTFMHSWKVNIWTYLNPKIAANRTVGSRPVRPYTPYRAEWVRRRR